MSSSIKVVDVLKAARVLITHRRNWTQGAYARNEHGDGLDNGAVCFCAMGAIDNVLGENVTLQEKHVVGAAIHSVLKGCVEDFNDRSSHKEVLFVFDQAIKECGEQ